MATWAIGKTFMWYEARSLHYRFYRFNLVDLLVFCWWFMSNIRNVFTFNSIGCVTKCGPAGILEGNNRQMYVRPTCSKSSYRKIWSNILTARWRASAWSDKMNKEQSADDPPWIWFVKNMLNSTISVELPWCCNCMYRNIRCLWKYSEQLRQRLWSTIIIWRIIPWWLTDHHNC